MSIDANQTGAARRGAHDHLAPEAPRPYVAPRLGPSQSVRDLTKGAAGSGSDAGAPGFMMMVMG